MTAGKILRIEKVIYGQVTDVSREKKQNLHNNNL